MEGRARVRYTRRHIPAELVEKTLLNLPLKSLIRFSAVSKSWNRMILGSGFSRKYRGREMMVLRLHSTDQKALVCPISAVSADHATPFFLPFKAADSYSDVSCGELRCVELGNTLCLYNPSTRAHRRLPPPSCPPRIGASIIATSISVFVYGLGYDSVTDDYKIFKAHRNLYGEAEVYSLRNDSWRKVSDSRKRIHSCISGDTGSRGTVDFHTHKGVFVSGALHWLVRRGCWTSEDGNQMESDIWVLSFDVSTEEYRKAAAPPLPECPGSTDELDVCVLRGRMCVCVNYEGRFVVWVMEDYVWNKDMEIDYQNIYPLCYSYLKPLYFYDGEGNLVKAVTSCTDIRKLFIIYKNVEEDSFGFVFVEKKFGNGSSKDVGVVDRFSYVESLVSPFPRDTNVNVNTEVESVVEVDRAEVERAVRDRTIYVNREGKCNLVEDLWAAYRGKYPDPTYAESNLINHFLIKFSLEDENFVEEESKSWICFKETLQRPNLRSLLLQFLRQVRESKGYDVDSNIDFSVSSSCILKRCGFFVPRGVEDEKLGIAAAKFAIGRINAHMCLMKRGNRYEVVRVEKLVSTTTDILLLTFTAKEIASAHVEIFQAMLQSDHSNSTFQLRDWKFKPIPF